MPAPLALPPALLLPLLACLAGLAGLAAGLFVAWLLNRAFLQEMAGFVAESFTDPRGRADGKQLSLWAVTLCVVGTFVNGWVRGKWPPGEIWLPTLFFLSAGYGFSMYENTKKMRAEADVAQAQITGQPAPGPTPEPATATTTTQTITKVE